MRAITNGFACALITAIFLSAFSAGLAAAGGGMSALILNSTVDAEGNPVKYPHFSFEEAYGITEHRFWPSRDAMKRILEDRGAWSEDWTQKHSDVYRPLDDGFREEIKDAGLIYIGQYTYGTFGFLFAREDYAALIRDFLSGGGMIIFDYYSGYRGAADFLESIGVDVPGFADIGYTDSYIWPEYSEHVLFNSPRKVVDGPRIRSYGGFRDWSGRQKALLRAGNDRRNEAVMIIQKGVLGAGRVVFNQTITTFRNRMPLSDNIIVYAFGFERFKAMIYEQKEYFDRWKKDLEPGMDFPRLENDILSLFESWKRVERKAASIEDYTVEEQAALLRESRELKLMSDRLMGEVLMERFIAGE